MIRFSVLGQPHPKGSKRAFVRGGKAVVTEQTSAGLATWRPRLQAVVAEAAGGDGPTAEPVAVIVTFRMAAPRKRRWPWPVAQNRGDLDKLSRTLLDELTSVVIADDSQVVLIAATKVYDERPGADVAVMPLMGLVDPEHRQNTLEHLAAELLALAQGLAVPYRREEVTTGGSPGPVHDGLDAAGSRAGEPRAAPS